MEEFYRNLIELFKSEYGDDIDKEYEPLIWGSVEGVRFLNGIDIDLYDDKICIYNYCGVDLPIISCKGYQVTLVGRSIFIRE